MNILIVTLNGYNCNYGNKLQNYASCRVFEKIGFSTVNTLCFEKTPDYLMRLKVKQMFHKLTGYKLCKNKNFWINGIERIQQFDNFDKKYLNVVYTRDIHSLDSKYDYFVIGSDQVWNPAWYDEDSLKQDVFLLTFTEPDKKICLAPSFGISYLPEAWENWFSNALKDFPVISVREESGADIIKKLTGKNAEVLIDPVLLLDQVEWKSIETIPDDIDFSNQYILCYFLGYQTEQIEKYITSIAKENDLLVYNLFDEEIPSLSRISPTDFIYLISHAKLVVTDSFHASVFSFLFEKPFIVCDRVEKGYENMTSRIETFLEKFGLKRKHINNIERHMLFEHNYKDNYQILENERKKVQIFLKNSINNDFTKVDN